MLQMICKNPLIGLSHSRVCTSAKVQQAPFNQSSLMWYQTLQPGITLQFKPPSIWTQHISDHRNKPVGWLFVCQEDYTKTTNTVGPDSGGCVSIRTDRVLWFMGCSGGSWCTESSAQTVTLRSVRCTFTLHVYKLAVMLKETSGHRRPCLWRQNQKQDVYLNTVMSQHEAENDT